MSAETEPLRLQPGAVQFAHNGYLVRVANSGRPLIEPAPERFQIFFGLQSQGFSIAAIAEHLRRDTAQSFRFHHLKEFILFLDERELLVSDAAIQLAEDLRSGSNWPDSVLLGSFFDLQLVSFGRRRPPSAARLNVALSFQVLALVGLAWLMAVCGSGVFRAATSSASPGANSWLIFILVFSIGRSLRALAQFFGLRFLSGAESSLSLRLDLLSMSFASRDVSEVRRPTPWFLLSSVLNLTTLFFWTGVKFPGVAAAAFALLLVDLCPLRRSPLSEILRALYNDLESRSARRWSSESWLRRVHQSLSAVWIALFLLFVIQPFRYQLHHARDSGEYLMRLLMSVVVLSLLVDLFSYLTDADYSLSNLRRRWRSVRKQASFDAPGRREWASEDLAQLPLLRQLPADIRRVFLAAENAQVLDVDRGVDVIREGKTDRALFVVLTGRFAVLKRRVGGSSAQQKLITVLEPGAVFGETAFFLGAARTASVRATEDSQVLRIRHDSRIADLDASKSDDLRLRVWFLAAMSKSEWFKELPPESMDALAFAGVRWQVRAGQKIIQEGERGDFCCMIIEGRATATQNFRVVNRLKSGDFVGEIALLRPGILRTATVLADTDVLMMRINSERFWPLLCSHLPLALEIERLSELRLLQDSER